MVMLEDVKWKIPQLFVSFKLVAGEISPFQTYNPIVVDWIPPEKKLVQEAIEALTSEGLIEKVATPTIGLRLTEAGETRAYSDHSIA